MPRWIVLGDLFDLLAADGELAVLEADLELVRPETRHRKGDAQGLRPSLPFRQHLDIVRRVARFAGLGRAVLSALVERLNHRSPSRSVMRDIEREPFETSGCAGGVF
jgi:hypothetical protein